jgi:hypothetical protein
MPHTTLSLREIEMKRLLLALAVLPVLTLGITGCSEKSTSTTEKTISTPGGTTTVKEEVEIKKSGDNPP